MILAIDLGTTNSVAGVWQDGAVRLLKSRHLSFLVPSVVSVLSSKSILVGEPAKERLRQDQEHTFALFKRAMGTRKSFGPHGHDAVSLSSLLLKAIKEDAEAELGLDLRRAIITVPAYFSEPQRQDTREAARLAGLEVVRLLNEPTAAALAYCLNEKNEELKIMVLDLGGGTFDISIIEKFEDMLDIHASGGDCFLGGEDFTLVLRTMIQRQLPQDHQSEARLHALAELCKRHLTHAERWQYTLTTDQASFELQVERSEFEKACKPLLDRMMQPIERALRDARMKPSDFDHVVLAGGATRMPCIRSMVSHYFKCFPLANLDPDTVIAQGAAIAAGMEMRDAALRDRVMTDVCPFTLGIEVMQGTLSGLFSPVIERNQKVPISREEQYRPANAGQKQVDLKIYQGENRYVKDNTLIGEIIIPIMKVPATDESFSVRFTYDISGLLEVEVKVDSTGLVQKLLIQRENSALGQDELAQRMILLQDLKIHPRDQAENQWLIARSQRLFQELLGEDRRLVAEALAAFEHTLKSQNPEAIEEFARQLKIFLDRLEGDARL